MLGCGTLIAIRLRIRREAEPNTRDAYGVAALHRAVSFGHAGLVKELISDQRVSVDMPVGDIDRERVPESYGAKSGRETPLHLAASHVYYEPENHNKY